MAAFFASRTAVISPCGIRLCMAFFPKPLGDLERVDSKIVPPGDFTASLVQLSMVAATERNGELIADFEAQGSRLRKLQVMRIRRLTPTDEACLCGNEF